MFNKSVRMLAVSAFVLCALTVGASAQAPIMTNKVSIEFDFYAGKKLMPAGQYEFKLTPNHQTQKLIQIRNVKTGSVATIPSVPNFNTKNAKPGEIVFNKYGDQYYLSRVQLGDSKYIHDVIKSRNERKLLRNIVTINYNDQILVPTTGQ